MKRCEFWNCQLPTQADHHYLCRDHFEDLNQKTIDQCPSCKRYKSISDSFCGDCARQQIIPSPVTAAQTEQGDGDAWAPGETKVERHYVYILKLNTGLFYVGETGDLRVRLAEHKDGKVISTAERNPRLQWFTEVPSKQAAVELEHQLKDVNDKKTREIRRLIIRFQDMVEELEFK